MGGAPARDAVTTAVPIPHDRHVPATELAQLVKGLEASGVVDDMLMWDQLAWFFPPSLWTPENTPLAAERDDPHSFPDVFALGGYLHAAAPNMGLAVSTDAVRRGPTELIQSMLTFQDLTGGRAIFQVGAGEAKQCKPFGWKRSQGVGRLRELFEISDAYWEARGGPIDYEGKYWNLKNAFIGGAMEHKPRIWALGGGPKLLDIATSYADGMAYLAPHAWDTPEKAAEEISSLKQDLERKGRDPEAFDFGIWVSALLHEDEEVLARAMDNPLMRWMSAIFGRVVLGDWEQLGIDSPLPADYHYAMNLVPIEVDAPEAQRVVDGVGPEQQRLSWVHGTPREVGEFLVGYVQAGVTWISVADVLPLTFPPDDPAIALQRTLDVCGMLKGRG